MLNENHALILDFPELKMDIVHLNHDSPVFKEKSQQYHQLDYDIRQLEIAGSPTNDEHMNQLKIKRAQLKDLLYLQLKEHHGSSSE
ncbi:YdcH family protein [Psychromonas aquimarina]|uniref:YdcH family protein n=1 Tax=Psychromonas aquimarina TaxID=444919 RepID=UPI0004242806|nr:YdcH family protein [Psychromonas aquimarina]